MVICLFICLCCAGCVLSLAFGILRESCRTFFVFLVGGGGHFLIECGRMYASQLLQLVDHVIRNVKQDQVSGKIEMMDQVWNFIPLQRIGFKLFSFAYRVASLPT